MTSYSGLAKGFTYNTQGLPFTQTMYKDAAATQVLNQDEDVYNGLGQLTIEYQSINDGAGASAVNTSTTPKVQYGYSSMANGG